MYYRFHTAPYGETNLSEGREALIAYTATRWEKEQHLKDILLYGFNWLTIFECTIRILLLVCFHIQTKGMTIDIVILDVGQMM